MAEEGTNEEQLDESLFIEEETQENPEPTMDPEGGDRTESGGFAEPKNDVPEKYRGKTAMEIIRMHQDAERLIGKQGNEVGELRKIVDDIVASTQEAQTSKAPEPEPDFFEDPEAATTRAARKVYESDPELKEIKQTVTEMRQRQAAQELLRRHPDAVELSHDPKFGEWVSKSNLRRNLFMQAHQKFDHEAASELFDLYKETKAYNKDIAQAATKERSNEVRKASTGSARASAETRAEPYLSREAIVELRIKDPEKYNRLLPKLKQAYRDKRAR